MHELSLAQGLIDQLLALADKHQAEKITKVTVIVGPFSGIVTDSFSFGFDALKQEQSPTKESVLVLETPPPEYTCLQCGNCFTSPAGQVQKPRPFSSTLPCPDCGGAHCTAKGGDELILKQLEME
ncbi:MAG: hydrogenase maturation nickel metallochaperone HypA [Desulfobulbaceae bacterium]|nr:hydrogenase maturation nickel metallochaperone HypA [Desulfobulbaceae bacterium]